MIQRGPLETIAWAAAGAVLLGAGMVLGLVSAAAGRRRERHPSAAPPQVPDSGLNRRVDDLATAVTGLQQRLDAVAAPLEKIDAVTERIGQLEKRVEQMAAEPPVAGPSIEQVLTAVEQMVATKIGGLDERLTDQVHAIELLRHASTQTDSLLQRLIQAVEGLAQQTSDVSPVLQVPRSDSGD